MAVSGDSNGVTYVTASWVPYHIHTITLGDMIIPLVVPYHIHTITLGDIIIPLVRSEGPSPRANDLARGAEGGRGEAAVRTCVITVGYEIEALINVFNSFFFAQLVWYG